MEEESWSRNHGVGIMGEESWRKKIMEEEPWGTLQGGGARITAVESLLRDPCCGSTAVESLLLDHCCGLRGVWEPSERRPRASGAFWEAPWRVPGEAFGEPGCPGWQGQVWEQKVLKNIVFYSI